MCIKKTMRLSRIFLSVAVVASVGASAQTAVVSDGTFIRRQSASLETQAVARIADNQRYVGNEIDGYCNSGFGIHGYTGSFKCGGMVAKGLLADYIGCKIVGMRFYLCEPVGKSTAFVTTVAAQNGYITDPPVLSKEVAETRQGWNEVMFDYPYSIGESSTLRGFMVGYTFEQTAEGKPNTPIAVSGTGTSYGFMIYGNLDQGTSWYNMGTTNGNLMVQLIVEREGGFLAYDVAMDQFLPGVLYAKAGETRSFGFYCHNVGTGEIAKNGMTFGVSVDGSEVGEFSNSEAVEAGDNGSRVEGTVTMPGDLSLGSHDMSVYVKSVNGAEPEGNLGNDRLTSQFKVYAESFPRQKQLVEQFTSQYCMYCPRGYDVLNGLAEKRGDLAWIAYHGDMGDNQRDEYTIADSYNFMAFSCGGNLPAASVNRYYYDKVDVNFYKTVGLTTAYSSLQKDLGISLFDGLINMSADIYPSFTTVDISSSFDAASRQLTVTVSGKTAAQFAELFGDDAALSVYLTEDGLWGKQKNGDRMMSRYPHDHTLRMFLTSPYGDALGAAEGKYEKKFTVSLDSKWNADNMHVIAVVSRPVKTTVHGNSLYLASKGSDLWVDNAEMVKLGASTTGISSVSAPATAAQTRVYSLDGTCLGTSVDRLPKGIYIVGGKKIVK